MKKILTLESSSDWFEESPLFEFWIIGSLYIVVGISKTIVSGEIIGDNRYIDVIFELWISNKKVKYVQKLADIHVVCSLFSNDLFKLLPSFWFLTKLVKKSRTIALLQLSVIKIMLFLAKNHFEIVPSIFVSR